MSCTCICRPRRRVRVREAPHSNSIGFFLHNTVACVPAVAETENPLVGWLNSTLFVMCVCVWTHPCVYLHTHTHTQSDNSEATSRRISVWNKHTCKHVRASHSSASAAAQRTQELQKKKSLTTDVSCECGLPHVGFSLYLYVVLAKYTCMYVYKYARVHGCALGVLMSVRMSIRCDLNAARVQHHPQSCRGTHGMQPILFIWTSRGYGLLTMYHYSVCLCACVGEREGRAANCLQLCHSLRNKSCTDRQVAEQALCDT